MQVASVLERWSFGSSPPWGFYDGFFTISCDVQSIPSFYHPILYIEWMILLQNWAVDTHICW